MENPTSDFLIVHLILVEGKLFEIPNMFHIRQLSAGGQNARGRRGGKGERLGLPGGRQG